MTSTKCGPVVWRSCHTRIACFAHVMNGRHELRHDQKTQGTRNDSVQTTDLPELWQPLQFSRKCERARVNRLSVVTGALHPSRAQQDGHTAQSDSVSRNSNDMAARATPIRLIPHKKLNEESCGRSESARPSCVRLHKVHAAPADHNERRDINYNASRQVAMFQYGVKTMKGCNRSDLAAWTAHT